MMKFDNVLKIGSMNSSSVIADIPSVIPKMPPTLPIKPWVSKLIDEMYCSSCLLYDSFSVEYKSEVSAYSWGRNVWGG